MTVFPSHLKRGRGEGEGQKSHHHVPAPNLQKKERRGRVEQIKGTRAPLADHDRLLDLDTGAGLNTFANCRGVSRRRRRRPKYTRMMLYCGYYRS